MKRAKLLLVLIIIIIIGAPVTVLALDKGLDTQPLSDKEISSVAGQRDFVKILSYTPLPATCFDVRDDHMVVIGVDDGTAAIIAVYDSRGIFQYGFKTTEPGAFRVMWSGSEIAYYSIRSKYIFTLNEDGKITDIRRVASTAENSIYDRDVLLSTMRKVDNSTYRMTNESAIGDALSVSFKRIIKTDTEGTTVVYDANDNYLARAMGELVVFVVLSSIIVIRVIIVIKRSREHSRTNKEEG